MIIRSIRDGVFDETTILSRRTVEQGSEMFRCICEHEEETVEEEFPMVQNCLT